MTMSVTAAICFLLMLLCAPSSQAKGKPDPFDDQCEAVDLIIKSTPAFFQRCVMTGNKQGCINATCAGICDGLAGFFTIPPEKKMIQDCMLMGEKCEPMKTEYQKDPAKRISCARYKYVYTAHSKDVRDCIKDGTQPTGCNGVEFCEKACDDWHILFKEMPLDAKACGLKEVAREGKEKVKKMFKAWEIKVHGMGKALVNKVNAIGKKFKEMKSKVDVEEVLRKMTEALKKAQEAQS